MNRFVPAAFVLGVAALAANARAERLDTVVPLGGTADAAVTRAGDVASVGFLVTEGGRRKLSLQVKLPKGSTLAPDVRLVTPDGNLFDVAGNGGSVSVSATSWKAKLRGVPQTGLWRVEVRGANGSWGAFGVKVTGKDGEEVSGSPPPIAPGGVQDAQILAGEGAVLTVSAKRAQGSHIVPQVTILDSAGSVVGAVAVGNDAKGTLKVKGVRLPAFGRYTLRFSGANGTGGSITYSASTSSAKVKGDLPAASPAVASQPSLGLPAERFAEAEPRTSVALEAAAVGASSAYRWVQVSGPPVAISAPATAHASFVTPDGITSLAFQLTVSQDGLLSRPETVVVEVARRPVADAGRSIAVAPGAAVTLDGSASFDRHGYGLAYAWRQMPGDDVAVALSDPAAAAPSFAAPAGSHTLHFGLRVDDGSARSFEDVVVVAVGAGAASVADAGREQFVPRTASVHLSALATSRASGVLDGGLQWTQVAGAPVALAGATTPFPSFTAPRTNADLVFELTADGAAATADRVAVHVRAAETDLAAPTTGNGPLGAAEGDVEMSASDTTDPEGNLLAFRWAQVAGDALAPAAVTGPVVTVAVPAGDAEYVYAVMSNDGLQYGTPDLVSVRNAAFAAEPISYAGPDRSVDTTTGDAPDVTLDGTGSFRTDGQAGALGYRWTQVSGRDWFDATATAAFDATAAKPVFALPAGTGTLTTTRTLLFQLVVSDGTASSQPDFVTVTWTGAPVDAVPTVTAEVSDENPVAGATVTLHGTAADAEGDPLTYRWTQTAGPGLALAPDATTLSPTFVAPESGVFAFQLVADDGFEKSAPATVSVTVDRRPVANVVVTPPQGLPGVNVTMDATSSSDPEGHGLTYAWTQVSGPAVTISDPAAAVVTFTAPAGAVAFRLVVNDGRQDSFPRQASFSGNPPPTVTASAANVDTAILGSPQLPAAAYGSTVTLVATPGPGGPFTYTWRQINPASGLTMTLSSTTAQNPTFTVPLPTTSPYGAIPVVTFGVRASDGTVQSPESTITLKLFASLNNRTASTSSLTVMSIISSKCASCHSGTGSFCPVGSGSNATGYGMGTKAAFLANSQRLDCSTTKYRVPPTGIYGASTKQSTLWDRVSGAVQPQMPTSGSLTQTEMNVIQDWIDQGVFDN